MIDIRALKDDDFPFLQQMAVQAMWWQQSPSDLPSISEALAHPEFAKLLDGWGRSGDRALVATDGRARVGTAWFRLWTPDHRSYGFVDPQTPELGIAVLPASRRQGAGRALLRRLMDVARADGYRSLSLSVSAENPARILYESEGFVRLSEDAGGSWTMLVRLDESER